MNTQSLANNPPLILNHIQQQERWIRLARLRNSKNQSILIHYFQLL